MSRERLRALLLQLGHNSADIVDGKRKMPDPQSIRGLDPSLKGA
jgi:hypothetical protein